MNGQLILHSINMVTRNLVQALKVSLFPLAAFGLVAYIGLSGPSGEQLFNDTVPSSGGGGVILLAVALALGLVVITSWVPVLWHRFVLLEEYPSWVPPLHLPFVLSYIGKLFAISAILIATLLAGGVVFAILTLFLGGLVAALGSVIEMAVIVVMYYLSLRFSLALTSAAIGKQMGVFDSYRLTEPHSRVIFQLAIMLGAINVVVSLLLSPVFAINSQLGMVFEIPLQWAQFMLGLALQTTIYGIIVEKRDLG